MYRGVWSHSETGSDKLVKEEVAVKTIDHQVSQKDKVKFLQEATIMAQFKHSNILRIRGVLTELPVRGTNSNLTPQNLNLYNKATSLVLRPQIRLHHRNSMA